MCTLTYNMQCKKHLDRLHKMLCWLQQTSFYRCCYRFFFLFHPSQTTVYVIYRKTVSTSLTYPNLIINLNSDTTFFSPFEWYNICFIQIYAQGSSFKVLYYFVTVLTDNFFQFLQISLLIRIWSITGIHTCPSITEFRLVTYIYN
jgi:hypothetical protein